MLNADTVENGRFAHPSKFPATLSVFTVWLTCQLVLINRTKWKFRLLASWRLKNICIKVYFYYIRNGFELKLSKSIEVISENCRFAHVCVYEGLLPVFWCKKLHEKNLDWPMYVRLCNCIAGRIYIQNAPLCAIFDINQLSIRIAKLLFNTIIVKNLIVHSYFITYCHMGLF